MKKLFVFVTVLAFLLGFPGCSATGSLSPTIQEVGLSTAPVSLAATPKKITPEQAIEIALKHAGLAEEQVRFLRAELETERGIPKYEVDFVSNGWEYEYDIHAGTGEILSFEKDT